MAANEEIKALAIKIALENSSFTEGVKSLKKELNVIDSEFKSSVAGLKDWGNNLDALKNNATALGDKIKVQKSIIETYDKQLQNSNETLSKNSEKMLDLKSKVESATAAWEQSKSEVGENDEATKKLKTELDNLSKKYESSNSLVIKNAQSVDGYTIQLNNAKGSLNKMESELEQTNNSIKDFDDKTKKASASVSGLSDDIKNKVNSFLKAVTIGIAAVSTALVTLINKTLESVDATQTAADIYGMTAEEVQAFAYAGAKLDVELETILKSQTKLTKAMYEAKDGTGEQSIAFNALGISVTDTSGNLRDAKTVMGEAFSALNAMGNETERDALAQKLFGKSAMELNPLIIAGSDALNKLTEEAKKSGAVMSNETVAGLDDLGDSVDAMKLSLQSAIGEALVPMTPKINDLIEKIETIDFTQIIDFASFLIEFTPYILGAFVAIKGFLIITDVVKGFQLFKKALVETEVVTKLVTAAQWLWNAAMNANPIGAIIIAIGALVGAYIYLKNAIGDAKEEAQAAADAQIEANNKVLEELNAVIEEKISAEAEYWAGNEKNINDAYNEEVEKGQKLLEDKKANLNERQRLNDSAHNAEIQRIKDEYGVYEEKEKSKTELAQDEYDNKISLIEEMTAMSEEAATAENDTFSDTYNAILAKAREIHSEKMAMYEREYLASIGLINSDLAATVQKYQDEINAINDKTSEENRIIKEQSDAQKILDLQAKVNAATTDAELITASKTLNDEIASQNRERLIAEREANITALNQKIVNAREKATEEKNALLVVLKTKLAGEQIEIKKNTDYNISQIQAERVAKETAENQKYEASKKALDDESNYLNTWIDSVYKASLNKKLNADLATEAARHKAIMDNLQAEADKNTANTKQANDTAYVVSLQAQLDKVQSELTAYDNSPIIAQLEFTNALNSSINYFKEKSLIKDIDAEKARLHDAGIPGFASGVTNFGGGYARVNEEGGEIRYLNKGTTVIPHDISVQIAKGISDSIANRNASSNNYNSSYYPTQLVIRNEVGGMIISTTTVDVTPELLSLDNRRRGVFA